MGTLLLIVLVIAAVSVLLSKSPSLKSGPAFSLKARGVLTRPEQILYFRLVQALPDHVVLSQVQLSRLVTITAKSGRQSMRNRLDRKSVDFVLCNRDFSIGAAVELDDSSHDRADRQQADAVKDRALHAAGVRVFRWHVKAMPSVEEIRQQVLVSS